MLTKLKKIGFSIGEIDLFSCSTQRSLLTISEMVRVSGCPHDDLFEIGFESVCKPLHLLS